MIPQSPKPATGSWPAFSSCFIPELVGLPRKELCSNIDKKCANRAKGNALLISYHLIADTAAINKISVHVEND